MTILYNQFSLVIFPHPTTNFRPKSVLFILFHTWVQGKVKNFHLFSASPIQVLLVDDCVFRKTFLIFPIVSTSMVEAVVSEMFPKLRWSQKK